MRNEKMHPANQIWFGFGLLTNKLEKTRTIPAGTTPGQYAIAGSLEPPSNVVCLPHRKGPLLPPAFKVQYQGIEQPNFIFYSTATLAETHWILFIHLFAL